jgi:anti-sigma regulatory factor (Ser/Thr protein kinase)
VSLELPPRHEASAAARTALASLHGALNLVSEARLRDVQLLASELVANAVVHGGDRESPLRIAARVGERCRLWRGDLWLTKWRGFQIAHHPLRVSHQRSNSTRSEVLLFGGAWALRYSRIELTDGT